VLADAADFIVESRLWHLGFVADPELRASDFAVVESRLWHLSRGALLFDEWHDWRV
jgi:hypothetical protein